MRTIGYEWLQTIPVARTQSNVEYFEAMHSRYLTVAWLQSIHLAGVTYFLGTLSGFLGYGVMNIVRNTR